MNQLLGPSAGNPSSSSDNQVINEPGQIALNVRVQYGQGAQQTVQLNLDASAPFNILVSVIKQNVFAQNMSNQFEESIKYSFNGVILEESDLRPLNVIGLANGSFIDVRLNYKGGY